MNPFIYYAASRPVPFAALTTGGSITLAMTSFFEKSLPIIQWFAGIGSLGCIALTITIGYYTLSEKQYARRLRIEERKRRQNAEKKNQKAEH